MAYTTTTVFNPFTKSPQYVTDTVSNVTLTNYASLVAWGGVFTGNAIVGTLSSTITGNITTITNTNAVVGTVVEILHSGGEPTISGTGMTIVKNAISTEYNDTLTKIKIRFLEGTTFEYWYDVQYSNTSSLFDEFDEVYIYSTYANDDDSAAINPNSGTTRDVDTAILDTRVGVKEGDTGTNTNGGGGRRGENPIIRLGGWKVVFESDIYLPSTSSLGNANALSDGTNTYFIKVGFSNAVTTGRGTDNVMFYYTHASATTTKWMAETASGNVRTGTETDTGITVSLDTWYRMRIEINNAATEVRFYINGTLVATNTANIPTGVNLCPVWFAVVKSAGTTNRYCWNDKYAMRITA